MNTILKSSAASLGRRPLILLKSDRLSDGRALALLHVAAKMIAAGLFIAAVTAVETRAQSERAMTDADVTFVIEAEERKEVPAPAAEPQGPSHTSSSAPLAVRGVRKRALNPTILRIVQDAGRRHAVDAELILSVMAQESNFISTAVSYKNGRPCARGLMQLTTPTAARFGVTDPLDPKENIEGGVKYLRFLLDTFGDERLDLVLAGYNAGEGAVLRYKRSVPPYKETRNYVRVILARYNSTRHLLAPSSR